MRVFCLVVKNLSSRYIYISFLSRVSNNHPLSVCRYTPADAAVADGSNAFSMRWVVSHLSSTFDRILGIFVFEQTQTIFDYSHLGILVFPFLISTFYLFACRLSRKQKKKQFDGKTKNKIDKKYFLDLPPIRDFEQLK